MSLLKSSKGISAMGLFPKNVPALLISTSGVPNSLLIFSKALLTDISSLTSAEIVNTLINGLAFSASALASSKPDWLRATRTRALAWALAIAGLNACGVRDITERRSAKNTILCWGCICQAGDATYTLSNAGTRSSQDDNFPCQAMSWLAWVNGLVGVAMRCCSEGLEVQKEIRRRPSHSDASLIMRLRSEGNNGPNTMSH